ncbi:hypothetical protein [Dyadobacter arcticus]|uniref:Uncharacterized protein n=1 Tax=Dyadobacter arcticus TaxID=1078754 RepID=A0ABX0UFS5_9BACT|nr:hypothetical protein [Dyadobacter arcticus]NIJ51836.1 hypothetical protein [Dyadobacter arcticus]
MKTFQVTVTSSSVESEIKSFLDSMAQRGVITFKELSDDDSPEAATPASEEQVQEMIDEAELKPYYSDSEAKDILKL